MTVPSSIVAGTAFDATLSFVTTSGTVDSSVSGTQALTVTGAQNSPFGVAPTLPTSATFTDGVAKVAVTLTDAATQTLTFTVDGVSGTVTVTPTAGAATFAVVGTLVDGSTDLTASSVTLTSDAAEGITDEASQTVSGVTAQTTYTVTTQLVDANGNAESSNAGVTEVLASVRSGGARYSASSVSAVTVHSNGTATFTYTTGTPGTSNGTVNQPTDVVPDTITIAVNPTSEFSADETVLTTNAF